MNNYIQHGVGRAFFLLLLFLVTPAQAGIIDYVITFEQTYGQDSDLGLTTGTFSAESTMNGVVTELIVIATSVDTPTGSWEGPDYGVVTVEWNSPSDGSPNFVPLDHTFPFLYGRVDDRDLGNDLPMFLNFSGDVAGDWSASVDWTGQTGTILGGGTYTIALATVPIPATIWLFGSGLLGLVGMARRKKAA